MNKFNYFAPFYDRFMLSFGMYRHKLIIDKLQPQDNDLILDAGGGTGFIAHKIAEKGSKVVVLDKSKRMLKRAEKRGLETVLASALELPFDDNHFDKIICIDALHHIKDHENAAKEFHRVLKPNGKLMIVDFHQKKLSGKLIKHFELVFIDNSKFISPERLETLMQKTGFNGKSEIFSGYEFYYLGVK